jgi:hypothetical protein
VFVSKSDTFFKMPAVAKLNQFSLFAAFWIPQCLAHPLFNGKLVARVEDLNTQYDYVVVGAGASGLTVANRLSEQEGESLMSDSPNGS